MSLRIERRARIRRRALAAFCAAALLAPPGAGAQPARPPGDCLAWWTYSPSSADAPPAVASLAVEGALRALLRAGIVADQDSQELLAGLLAASVLSGASHTACLLDLSGVARPEGELEISSLQAVVEIAPPLDQKALLRTIEAIAVGPDPAGASQRALALPAGRSGVALRRASWPDWLEVSWTLIDSRFCVGVGAGALERWLAPPSPNAASPWSPHAAAVHAVRPPGRPVLEAYASIDALRRRLPEAMGAGRGGRVLRAWRLINARDAMLHARLVPGPGHALVAADFTWSVRSRPPGDVERRAVSQDAWPAELGPPPPSSSALFVARVDWTALRDWALATYRETRRAWDAIDFDVRRRRWEREHADTLDRLLGALDPWLILAGDDAAVLRLAGIALAFAPLPPDRLADAARDLDRVARLFPERIVRDVEGSAWSLRLADAAADPAHLTRVVTWGVVPGRGIAAAWSPAGFARAQTRLAPP